MNDLFLVTGATGLVGNNVVRLLLGQNRRVRVLVRASSDPRPLAGLPVEVVQGDIQDSTSVQSACQGIDCVIHAAGYVQLGRSRPDLHQAINVDGAREVARQARRVGARMIHVSSCTQDYALGMIGSVQVRQNHLSGKTLNSANAAENGPGQGVSIPEGLIEKNVNILIGCILHHIDFLENNLALPFHFSMIKD